MLTLIISTPRSGSNTFAKSLKGEIWIPEDHPGYNKHYELFNFKPLTVDTDKLITFYHTMLLDYLEKNTSKNIIVKVLVNTVNSNVLKSLIKHSSIIYHTVRLDYAAQLKSLVCAKKQNKWLERVDTSSVVIEQQDINNNHTYLTQCIKDHSKIYSMYGGLIEPLEERIQQPYKIIDIVGDNLQWPSFPTKEYFK